MRSFKTTTYQSILFAFVFISSFVCRSFSACGLNQLTLDTTVVSPTSVGSGNYPVAVNTAQTKVVAAEFNTCTSMLTIRIRSFDRGGGVYYPVTTAIGGLKKISPTLSKTESTYFSTYTKERSVSGSLGVYKEDGTLMGPLIFDTQAKAELLLNKATGAMEMTYKYTVPGNDKGVVTDTDITLPSGVRPSLEYTFILKGVATNR